MERGPARPPRTGRWPWRLPLSLAMRGEPGELGDGLVGDQADLGHLRHQPGDGAAGDALDRAEGGVEAAHSGSSSISEAISPSSRRAWRLSRTMTSSRLASVSASLGRGPALLVDGEVAGHLGEPGNQRLEPLLGGARRRRRPDLLTSA